MADPLWLKGDFPAFAPVAELMDPERACVFDGVRAAPVMG
jgi:hypothetical protein